MKRLIFILVLAMLSPAVADDGPVSPEEAQRRLQEAKQRADAEANDPAVLRKRNAELQEEVKRLRREVAELKATIAEMAKRLPKKEEPKDVVAKAQDAGLNYELYLAWKPGERYRLDYSIDHHYMVYKVVNDTKAVCKFRHRMGNKWHLVIVKGPATSSMFDDGDWSWDKKTVWTVGRDTWGGSTLPTLESGE